MIASPETSRTVARIRKPTIVSLVGRVTRSSWSLPPLGGWWFRLRVWRAISDPPVHPAEHFVVPLDRILRLQHPMVLVGEDDQPRWNVAPLQRGEGRDSLGIGDAEIILAGDHQLRGLPVLDVIDRVPLFELGRRFIIRMGAVLP